MYSPGIPHLPSVWTDAVEGDKDGKNGSEKEMAPDYVADLALKAIPNKIFPSWAISESLWVSQRPN